MHTLRPFDLLKLLNEGDWDLGCCSRIRGHSLINEQVYFIAEISEKVLNCFTVNLKSSLDPD